MEQIPLMATVRCQVKPTVLDWAIQRAGIPLEKRFPRLKDWLSGAKQPTLRQLEKLARAIYVPFGYLLLSEPPPERPLIPHFRSGPPAEKGPLSPNLLDTISLMRSRQAWLRDYLSKLGCRRLPFEGSQAMDSDPRRVASAIRKDLGLQPEWAAREKNWEGALAELYRRIEEVGILVVINSIVGNNTHRKLNVDEFRGFVLVDEYAPLIFINGADSKAAQMFTLGHELAHVWLGQSASFDLHVLRPANDPTEQACNRIAAEFLVPAEELKTFWPQVRHTHDRLRAVAQQFKVSELVAARRVFDLNFIGEREYFQVYEQYQKKVGEKRPAQKTGNFYQTQKFRLGKKFSEAIICAVREGQITYEEAYHFTGLYGKTFEKYAQSVLGE